MKKSFCILLIISVLLSSCSSIMYPLTRERCNEINQKADGNRAVVTLRYSAEEIRADRIQLDPDTLYWQNDDYSDMSFAPVPVDMISEIDVRNRVAGMLLGAGVGLVPFISLALSEQDADSELSGKEYEMAKGFGLVLTGCVAVTLGIVGYYRGLSHYYSIEEPGLWQELRNIEALMGTGRYEEALEILDRTINESPQADLVTTALYLKMKYELEDPTKVYEELYLKYPNHINTYLAERLLIEEFGYQPVK